MFFKTLPLLMLLCVPQFLSASEADEQAIRAMVSSYVAAFNRHDAAAVASHWLPDAVYVSKTSGDKVVGRDKISNEFENYFQQSKDAKLRVSVGSIQFVSPNVAVEHGTATLTDADGPLDTTYTAVYLKRDGKWLLDRVTDEEARIAPTHYEQLKPLEWMIGKWVDQDEDVKIETDCKWTRNRNYIIRTFKVTIGEQVDLTGIQIIGWDAAAKQVHSWVFDSDGGFAEGTWTQKANQWFVRKKGVLSDGRKTTAVNIIRVLDDNTHTVQSVSRTAGESLLPNIDEVKVVRQNDDS